MKPHFSIGEAVSEPFRMLGRRPLAMMIWGLVALLPVIAGFALMIPMLGGFAEMARVSALDLDASVDTAVFGEDMAEMVQFQIWSQLINLLQAVGTLLATTAIIRAVYAGRRGDRTAFLRFGMDELHVVVVGIAVVVGMIFLLLVAALIAVGAGLALWGVPDPWRTLIYVAMGGAVLLGFLLLLGRLALLAPACIHYKTFAFVEGWNLGRGQTWRLFGLMLVLMVACILISLVAILLIVVIVFAVGGGMGVLSDPTAAEAWAESLEERPGMLIGLGAALLLPMLYFQGFSQALLTAPYAVAVRALAGGGDAPPEKVEDAAPQSGLHSDDASKGDI